MLSDREARVLRGIEQRLAAEDPEFVAAMTGTPRRRWQWVRAVLKGLAVAAGAALVFLCLLLGAAGVVALAVGVATVVLVRRRHRIARWLHRHLP